MPSSASPGQLLDRTRPGPLQFFATCARGIEPVLARELVALDAAEVVAARGGVHFQGDKELLYRANLWLRSAIRVLQPILQVDAHTTEELYDAVRIIDWQRYLTTEHTIAVDCNVRDSHITHSKYAALKTKDAICDQFVDRLGRRPSVDVERPMVGLNLHIHRDVAVLSLDSSGDSLHKRGYRSILTKAPLNEALAAALVLISGWQHDTPFADPMCGSGTLPIEAGWMATARAPGLTRRHFGFQGWMDFDVSLWTALRDDARSQILKRLKAPILGSDARADAIRHSMRNARSAGLGHLLQFDIRDIRKWRAPDGPPGTLICNPPYGQRMGEAHELSGLYHCLGKVFRQQCRGWNVFVFTANRALAGSIGLPMIGSTALFNGKIACQLSQFETT
jgi:putative N6-adenine-specific DNA methylase